jgi:hypothetical protein
MFNRIVAALWAAVFLLLGLPVQAAAPTAFPQGFNNLPSTNWLAGRDVLPVPYPGRMYVFWDDFLQDYTASDWVVTATGSGSEAIDDLNGGALLITNAAADDDRQFLQTPGELFTFAAGKKMYFEARFKVSDATQSDFVMGLQVRDTTPLAVSDGVFFQKDDGDTQIDFHNESGSVDTVSTNVATATTSFVTVAFYYDGATSIVAAVDNVPVATTAVTPSATELTVSYGIQNGEAVAKTMSVDLIFVAREK